MSWEGVPPAFVALGEAAIAFFRTEYDVKDIGILRNVVPHLKWRPHLAFAGPNYLQITGEITESPYPEILKLRTAELLRLPDPIAVYAICSSDSYHATSTGLAEGRKLRADGFGLLTIDSNGAVNREFQAIPLVQHISDIQFDHEIASLRATIAKRVKQAITSYASGPISGVRDVSELVEGVVYAAVKKCVAKSELQKSSLSLSAAYQVDALETVKALAGAKAALGGARSYLKTYRNMAHHFPKSRSAAIRKYGTVRMGFISGIHVLTDLDAAFRKCGYLITLA